MAGYPHLPLFVKDYLVDTTHLTLEQSGAYLHLLMHAWTRGGTVADDDRQLAAFCKVSLKKWKAIRPALEPFFQIIEGAWNNKRLSQEWQYVRDVSEKRAAAGAKGGKVGGPKNNGLDKQMQKPGLSPAEAPTPTPTPIIPEDKSSGQNVDSDKAFWDSAKAYLGKSKAGLIAKWCRDYGQPETASAITRSQLERAVDPPSFIAACLKRGTKAGTGNQAEAFFGGVTV